jgi:outer membrane lipoprotein-sorting protein
MKKLFSLALVLFVLVAANQPTVNTKAVVTNMLTSIDNVKTLSYTMKGWERMKDGKQQFSEIDAKIQVKPQKIYIYNKAEPNKDVQILYNEELWGTKAYVNAGKFIPNLKLDPFGGRMRDKQHHTILNTGFATTSGIIKNALQRQQKEMPDAFEKYVQYEGDITWNGIECYKITITDPTFAYIDYVVKEGEDVEKLERTRYICGHLIIEKNPSVKDFWSLKAGMKIKIPTSYAKKTVMYIDKKTNLPLVQIMSDEVGQFEKYEFYNVKVNPVFSENVFKEF